MLQPDTAVLIQRLANSLSVFTKHYDPRWMDAWKDEDQQSSTFSKHTFGELREARKLIAEADSFVTSNPIPEPQTTGKSRPLRVQDAENAEAGARKISDFLDQTPKPQTAGRWLPIAQADKDTDLRREGWED